MSNELAAKLYGVDLFGEPQTPKPTGPVAERFGFAPFTVLDAKQGEWQDRKRAWIAMGIRGEQGRNGLGDTCVTPMSYFQNGKTIGGDAGSIFDPVLCECAYRWFCPAGGQVVDPFAGGSVRGIVAGALGLRYWGCDLRPEQVAANEEQARTIGVAPSPVWLVGDSTETLADAPDADFVFSCPPYGDLEVYSDDPADLSNMEYHTFSAAYRLIIARALRRLKPDRFACFVVGDFRDKAGHYRDFVSMTIAAFRDGGAQLYNEAILATSVGSAALRVTRQFMGGRKLCKTHQNLLVFVKGDWKKAAMAIADSYPPIHDTPVD